MDGRNPVPFGNHCQLLVTMKHCKQRDYSRYAGANHLPTGSIIYQLVQDFFHPQYSRSLMYLLIATWTRTTDPGCFERIPVAQLLKNGSLVRQKSKPSKDRAEDGKKLDLTKEIDT